MKNEIFLVTFLLIVFFSIGGENQGQGDKINEMGQDNYKGNNKMEYGNKAQLKFRSYSSFDNNDYEYIKQVRNELKRLSDDVSNLKIESNWSNSNTKNDFLEKIVMVASSTNRMDRHLETLQNSPESKWNKIKAQYIDSLNNSSHLTIKNNELVINRNDDW